MCVAFILRRALNRSRPLHTTRNVFGDSLRGREIIETVPAMFDAFALRLSASARPNRKSRDDAHHVCDSKTDCASDMIVVGRVFSMIVTSL